MAAGFLARAAHILGRGIGPIEATVAVVVAPGTNYFMHEQ